MTNLPENVHLRVGNMFSTQLPALGHGVNVDGLMGAGVAKLVRSRNPEVYEAYRKACRSGALVPGQMFPAQTITGRWVLNLASQDRPGPHARLEWFEQALVQSFRFAVSKNLNGFAIPRIGAGIGGLEWRDVLNVIATVAAEFPQVIIEVWSLEADAEPQETRSIFRSLGEGLLILDRYLPANEQRVPDAAGYLVDGSSWLHIEVDPKDMQAEDVAALRRLGWRVAPNDDAFEFGTV